MKTFKFWFLVFLEATKTFKFWFWLSLIGALVLAALDCAEAQTFEEMRENGTLIILTIFGIFGGFYLLCVVICLLAGETEKRVDRRRKPKPKPEPDQELDTTKPWSPDYIMPRARNYYPRKTRKIVRDY